MHDGPTVHVIDSVLLGNSGIIAIDIAATLLTNQLAAQNTKGHDASTQQRVRTRLWTRRGGQVIDAALDRCVTTVRTRDAAVVVRRGHKRQRVIGDRVLSGVGRRKYLDLVRRRPGDECLATVAAQSAQ